MLNEKTVIGDAKIEAQLKEKSSKLNISVDELIDRYIRRELYSDDFYEAKPHSQEELIEISKKEIQKDKKKGIMPKNNDFDVFVGMDDKEGFSMDFHYEIKNEKLKKMVENKAGEMHMDVNRLIWGYVNRGLMKDNLDEDLFNELHSEAFLKEVNDALNVD